MKLLSTLILSMLVLVGCGAAEEPAPVPEPVPEAVVVQTPTQTHPEIMQEIASTRPTLQSSIEAGNADAASEAALRLEELFDSVIPMYEERNLPGAIDIASSASAAAGEAAAAAEAGDLEAALAAHGNVQASCASCHGQYREKAEDGSYRFKAQ